MLENETKVDRSEALKDAFRGAVEQAVGATLREAMPEKSFSPVSHPFLSRPDTCFQRSEFLI